MKSKILAMVLLIIQSGFSENYYVPINAKVKYFSNEDVVNLKNDLYSIIDGMESYYNDIGIYPEGRKTDPSHHSFYELTISKLVENIHNNSEGIPSYSVQIKGSLVPNPHDN